MMEFELSTPSGQTRIADVAAVSAEGASIGAFEILPRHADYCAALVPSVLEVQSHGGKSAFFGIDEGILVKTGALVCVSVRRSFVGDSLPALRRRVAEEFAHETAEEKRARSSMAGLEADISRLFMELKNA